MSTVSEQLKYYRKQAKMTQKQLSEETGIAEITIRQYEAGKYQPKIENLHKISNALNVPLSFFLDDDFFDCLDLPEQDEEMFIQNKINELKTNPTLTNEEKKKKSRELYSQIEILGHTHLEEVNNAEKLLEQYQEETIICDFRKLNEIGKDEALKRVAELTELSKYTVKAPTT